MSAVEGLKKRDRLVFLCEKSRRTVQRSILVKWKLEEEILL